MSAQFDVIAGLDISSLASVTQSQFMQATNQLAPLSNIGFIITQAATDASISIQAGTKNSPDVANNPRFARYMWLNTHTTPATPFFYNANIGYWQSTLINHGAANSVNTDMLNANAGSTVIRHMFNDSTNVIAANLAIANQILALDATGQFVITVDPSTLTTNDINPKQIRINPTSPLDASVGTPGNVLTVNALNIPSWLPIDLSKGVTTGYFTGLLPITALAKGNASDVLQMVGTTVTWAPPPASAGLPPFTSPSLYLLRIKAGGTQAEWVNNNAFGTNLFPNGGVTSGIEKNKLAWEAPNTFLRMNSAGTAWEAVLESQLQIVRRQTTDLIEGGTAMTGPMAGGYVIASLDLTITPKSASSTLIIKCNLFLGVAPNTKVFYYIKLVNVGITYGIATAQNASSPNGPISASISYSMPSGSIAAKAFRVYFGTSNAFFPPWLNTNDFGSGFSTEPIYSSLEVSEVFLS